MKKIEELAQDTPLGRFLRSLAVRHGTGLCVPPWARMNISDREVGDLVAVELRYSGSPGWDAKPIPTGQDGPIGWYLVLESGTETSGMRVPTAMVNVALAELVELDPYEAGRIASWITSLEKEVRADKEE